jgi:hypothetical protein
MLLADELRERCGSHPRGKRLDFIEIGGFTLGEQIWHDSLVSK